MAGSRQTACSEFTKTTMSFYLFANASHKYCVKTNMASKLALAWYLLFSAVANVALAANPFSSNVVALTAKNWRQEVEESPHAVFVNICRQG